MTNGIGPQRPDDRRGWLVFDGLPVDLQHAEDATLEADHARAVGEFAPTRFTRLATASERQLLEHLGHVLPDQLTTSVEWLSNGLRCRAWPQLREGS